MKRLDDFTDAELAGMVRRSIYAQNTRFGDGETDSRFLLVLAVPYGKDDEVEDLPTALEALQRLMDPDEGGDGTDVQATTALASSSTLPAWKRRGSISATRRRHEKT